MGGLLYYTQAIDNTIIIALNTISSKQSSATAAAIKALSQIIDYVSNHLNTVARYNASSMYIHIDRDTSYLSV